MKKTLSFTEKYSYSIIAGAVLLLIAFMCSCSAKTTTKNETKNDSLVKDKTTLVDNSETKNSITTKSDSTAITKKESEFKSFLNEFEFESSDPTKESTIIDENGKKTTFKNLKGKKRNLSTQSKDNSLETVNLIKSKDIELHRKNKLIMDRNIEIQKLQSQLSKHSEKEALISWWVWLLLFILLCVAGRVAWLYCKGVNPFGWVLKLFKI